MSAVRLKRVARLMTDASDCGPRPLIALEHLEPATGKLFPGIDIKDILSPGPGVADIAVGDVLFGKLRPYLAKTWVANRNSFAATELLCLRPRDGVDSRWLGYVVASSPFIEWAVATSDGAKMPRTSWEKLGEFRIAIPSVTAQLSIADYLDRETARIDALIAAKRDMIDLLVEQIVSYRSVWFERLANKWGVVPLRRVIRRVEQGWSPQCENIAAEGEELGVLKTSAISKGTFAPNENKRLPDAETPDLRWAVKEGDLLMVRGSGSRFSVGQAVVATVGDRKLLLSDLIYRVCLAESQPEFVAMALQSPQVRLQVESSIRTDTGQTLKIRSDDVKGLLIPNLPSAMQSGVVREARVFMARVRDVREGLEQSILLLQERRQALITAAVTGQLDISEAA